MALPGYYDEIYENPTLSEKRKVTAFLEQQGLEYEDSVEMTLAVMDQTTGELVGTGSIHGKVMKCMAVNRSRRGEGLSSHILSSLVKEQFKRGRTHLFVFTNPKAIDESSGNVFAGFKMVAKTDEIVLLEMGSVSIDDYIAELKFTLRGLKKSPNQDIGSIVVNANPFTLGHLYLIETAAKECEYLIIFVVTEDRSVFPTKVRLALVRDGTKHLPNVKVIEGGDYIISPATFPRYFLKECDDISLAQARLDVTIFGEYIAPAIGITKRFVGEEPYCMVTKTYNQAMLEILKPKHIDLKILPRKEFEGEAISASKVRLHLRNGHLDKASELVPPVTHNYLISKEARPIIEKIKKEDSRH